MSEYKNKFIPTAVQFECVVVVAAAAANYFFISLVQFTAEVEEVKKKTQKICADRNVCGRFFVLFDRH